MTNKMPEVGKTYLFKHPWKNSLRTIIKIENGSIMTDGEGGSGAGGCFHHRLEDFEEEFEELPTKTKDDPKLQEEDKVRAALEELKSQLVCMKNTSGFMLTSIDLENLRDKAQNLVNALDGQKQEETEKKITEDILIYGSGIVKTSIDENGNLKRERIDPKDIYWEEKPESIWKSIVHNLYDVIRNSPKQTLIKLKSGQIIFGKYYHFSNFHTLSAQPIENDNIEAYAILTDFINHIELFEQRINKLENK